MSPDALDSNRRGELSATQRDSLVRPLQKRNSRALGVAGALFAVTLLFGFFAPPSLPVIWRIAIGVVTLGFAFSLVLRGLTGADRALSRDLRDGKVRAVSGPLTKEQEPAMDVESTSVNILRVGDERFTVSAAIFEAAPRGGQVRAYYLPESLTLVNLEMLADESPTGAPRPLADAIIGNWQNSFAKATFTANGRVTASMMGRQSEGAWSVDSQGRLHAEIAGRAEVAQASVTGDELTITLTGRVVTFARVT